MGRSFVVWMDVALTKNHSSQSLESEAVVEITSTSESERDKEAGGGHVYLYKAVQGPDNSRGKVNNMPIQTYQVSSENPL